ncbi:hypothetical protein [Caldicoprobacter faecalis]|uniref:D-alanyl-D-alanine carboxypeptidase n=1 Tax=Caldicoprobacter faecalis TaxID=937334 RepID=A0A1I5WPW2_9FIRM|nr:hypothetical protein [Caldicoprobacter faecalis]SFQ21769.1 hypothetical protein SAMN05444406_11838 [Caldicoprobacter faecalis]
MMKRFLALIVVLFVLSFHIQSSAAMLNPENSQNQDESADFIEKVEPSSTPTLELEAEGAVLIEQETGKVLYEKEQG